MDRTDRDAVACLLRALQKRGHVGGLVGRQQGQYPEQPGPEEDLLGRAPGGELGHRSRRVGRPKHRQYPTGEVVPKLEQL